MALPSHHAIEGVTTLVARSPDPLVVFHTMHPNGSPLGDCPHCSETLRSRHLLIEYESGSWVECPGCFDVVSPG